MSDKTRPRYGSIAWTDVTVADAPALRDFYAAVVGWVARDVDMGAYSDFNMHVPGDEAPVAGICHARGPNAALPSSWLIYILVPDVAESVRVCEERGGSVIDGPRQLGTMGRFAVIRDPAGGVVALFEPAVS